MAEPTTTANTADAPQVPRVVTSSPSSSPPPPGDNATTGGTTSPSHEQRSSDTPTLTTDSTKTAVITPQAPQAAQAVQVVQVPPPPPPASTKPLSPRARQVSLTLDEKSQISHTSQLDDPEKIRERDRERVRDGRYPFTPSRQMSMHRDVSDPQATLSPQAVPRGSNAYFSNWLGHPEPRPDPRANRPRSLFGSTQGPKTVRERLDPTLEATDSQIFKLSLKAKRIGLQLNAAIGLQVIVGAIITGLSAVTSGRPTQIATSVFGALATILASYLAKARGSEEPETSKMHCKELKEFKRDVDGFVLDHGDETGVQWDEQIAKYRARFEEIESRQHDNRRGMVQTNRSKV